MSPRLFKRLSDESLGSRLASGEAAAFDELYRRYVHRLAAYGSHLLGDAAAGEDVAQSTLLKAYGALRAGRVPAKLRPWLFRIAHNVAIDLVVRRRELPSGDLPERPGSESEPMAGALVAALAALPDRQRRVYVLREVHGMRIAETAAELGLTSAQVEQALFAARNRLAELLVFGDRLNCVAVRRLAVGPLDGDERRALKTHLRSCSECRHAVALRAPAWLPAPTLEWLRGLLVGGAAPAAAKVGAVVATATIAGGVPGAVALRPHAPTPAPEPRRVPARAAVAHPRQATAVSAILPAAAVVAPRTREADRHEASGSSDSADAGAISESRDAQDGGDAVATTSTSVPAAESDRSGSDRESSLRTTTTSSDDRASSSDGGDGGGSGSSGPD